MYKIILFSFLSVLLVNATHAQNEPEPDSLKNQTLQEVIIKAYEQRRKLLEIPAAINYIGTSQLNRFNNGNILPALNAMPGVKMEERSPGSYRLNIRGSSLRSPFGVRNVKIYYNDIPFTEPGGTTYLNQLGYYNFQSIEIIKGPGSSLYGSGTGGVMLIESNAANRQPGVNVDYSTGSFNQQNIHLGLITGTDKARNEINFQHQDGNGYRQHTDLRRTVFSWDASTAINEKQELSAHILYGDLYYQTPGALTLAEYQANRRAARPAVGTTPGSEKNQAAIYQKTFIAGITNKQTFTDNWHNTTTLYGAFTQLKNPTIRNYENTLAPHFGGRTVFEYDKKSGEVLVAWHTGAEFQQGYSAVRTYKNVLGNPDSLQTNDDINNRQFFVFTQLSLQLNKWIITAGISLNKADLKFTRLSTVPSAAQDRDYNNQLAPRIALLRKITSNLSVYGSLARGFSPPTSAELSPSGGILNTTLEPEQGIDYELGIRGKAINTRLYFDINAFFFHLKNTIVQRRDAAGGDFFINAGATRQNGLESYASYQLIDAHPHTLFNSTKLFFSYALDDFHYRNFKQLTNDFSGKQLPSVAKNTVSAGLDVFTKPGLYLNVTYTYSDPVALDDANTAFANSYNLLGGRIGFRKNIKRLKLELFTGLDNLFNVDYSLGNDINAFGGRYYNAAAGRNYFAGISLSYGGK